MQETREAIILYESPAHLDQCNYQEGLFFPPFLSLFWGGMESEKERDARKERLIFPEV